MQFVNVVFFFLFFFRWSFVLGVCAVLERFGELCFRILLRIFVYRSFFFVFSTSSLAFSSSPCSYSSSSFSLFILLYLLSLFPLLVFFFFNFPHLNSHVKLNLSLKPQKFSANNSTAETEWLGGSCKVKQQSCHEDKRLCMEIIMLQGIIPRALERPLNGKHLDLEHSNLLSLRTWKWNQLQQKQ